MEWRFERLLKILQKGNDYLRGELEKSMPQQEIDELLQSMLSNPMDSEMNNMRYSWEAKLWANALPAADNAATGSAPVPYAIPM